MSTYKNFKDIPQFEKTRYCIDVPLDGLLKHLQRYQESYKLELNPDFQRGHVWSKQQQVAYIEYLLQCPEKDKSTRVTFNYPGWQTRREQDDSVMVCIDGLQRLTAIKAFLNNELEAFGSYFNEFEGKLGWDRCIQIAVTGYENREEILKYYLVVNNTGVAHSKEELDRVEKLLQNERNKNGNNE